MTIQASIIEALRASQSAHQAGLSEVNLLRAQNAALEEKMSGLEAHVAALQAEAVKIVDPATVQPLLDELARAVAATHAAIAPPAPEHHAPQPEVHHEPQPEHHAEVQPEAHQEPAPAPEGHGHLPHADHYGEAANAA